jgi:hypothetical protein
MDGQCWQIAPETVVVAAVAVEALLREDFGARRGEDGNADPRSGNDRPGDGGDGADPLWMRRRKEATNLREEDIINTYIPNLNIII